MTTDFDIIVKYQLHSIIFLQMGCRIGKVTSQIIHENHSLRAGGIMIDWYEVSMTGGSFFGPYAPDIFSSGRNGILSGSETPLFDLPGTRTHTNAPNPSRFF
jgi:hypothetical protein